ncbi:hypothetical protein [Pseudoruegeria sp. SK021]|uniref:hypothetical protein n=1 Tax=Pseudoruegeria sp. SK021 TaxID=1933035 RepID=UPI000A23A182|nr:hypothetical protein [Pseudoruegeria sp. SK021]OSP56218.1 hypothetical protein BV911_02690 [Pseudoruegeria sp. SK021]
MPKLVRLYITQVCIGFALSAGFVALLVLSNVGNLAHLIGSSPIGWLAVFMLWFFNGIVFAGVQFALALPRASRPEGGGGRRPRTPVAHSDPMAIPVKVTPRNHRMTH